MNNHCSSYSSLCWLINAICVFIIILFILLFTFILKKITKKIKSLKNVPITNSKNDTSVNQKETNLSNESLNNVEINDNESKLQQVSADTKQASPMKLAFCMHLTYIASGFLILSLLRIFFLKVFGVNLASVSLLSIVVFLLLFIILSYFANKYFSSHEISNENFIRKTMIWNIIFSFIVFTLIVFSFVATGLFVMVTWATEVMGSFLSNPIDGWFSSYVLYVIYIIPSYFAFYCLIKQSVKRAKLISEQEVIEIAKQKEEKRFSLTNLKLLSENKFVFVVIIILIIYCSFVALNLSKSLLKTTDTQKHSSVSESQQLIFPEKVTSLYVSNDVDLKILNKIASSSNPSLEILDLKIDTKTPSIPQEVFQIQSIRELNLTMIIDVIPTENGTYTIQFPKEINNLSNLQKLTIKINNDYRINKKEHKIKLNISSLLNLRNLKELSIENQISIHPQLELVGQLPENLEIFGIDGFKFQTENNIPEISGGKLKKITISQGNETYEDDDGYKKFPQWIFKYNELESLDLSSINIESVPSEISSLKSLKILNLKNDKLKTLPSEISQLSNLEELYILYNPISSFPSEISSLKSLKILYASHTGIKTFPPEISQLSNLEELYIWQNQISSFPIEITNLKSLKSLNIESNELKTLPSEISQLSNLEKLRISNNHIPSLPDSIKEMTKLKSLIAYNTCITNDYTKARFSNSIIRLFIPFKDNEDTITGKITNIEISYDKEDCNK